MLLWWCWCLFGVADTVIAFGICCGGVVAYYDGLYRVVGVDGNVVMCDVAIDDGG